MTTRAAVKTPLHERVAAFPLIRRLPCLCFECAEAMGGHMDPAHMATSWMDTCGACGQRVGVCDWYDWRGLTMEALDRRRKETGCADDT